VKKLKFYYKKLRQDEDGFDDTMYSIKTPELSALCYALTQKHQKTLYIPDDKYQEIAKEIKMKEPKNKSYDHITIYDDSNYTFSCIRSDKYEKEDVKSMLKRDEENAKANVEEAN